MPVDCVQRYPVGRPLTSDLGEWFVARVKVRQEKALARVLAQCGIGYYLPVACKRHLRPDNGYPKRAWIPMFPGYVAFVGQANRSIVVRTQRVHGIIHVPDQEGFVRELEAVQQILASGLPCDTTAAIPLGAVVRITMGPLHDMMGILEATNGGHALIVRVDLFQQSVKVELPTASVAALDLLTGSPAPSVLPPSIPPLDKHLSPVVHRD